MFLRPYLATGIQLGEALCIKKFLKMHVNHQLTSVKVLRHMRVNLPAVRQSGFCDLAMHSIIIRALFFDILYQWQS